MDREGSRVGAGMGVKMNKNLSATEPKDITSLCIHSVSQQSPKAVCSVETQHVSLPFRPHGLLVHLRIH